MTNASYCNQARAGRAKPDKFDFAQAPAGSGKAPLVGALPKISCAPRQSHAARSTTTLATPRNRTLNGRPHEDRNFAYIVDEMIGCASPSV
jgi:hypothetical protein